MERFPQLVVDLKKLEHNIKKIKNRCDKSNIEIAAVIKGCSGFEEVGLLFDKIGVSYIASSRMEELIPLVGKVKASLMMVRIPMKSEAVDIVKYIDVSLNSEIEVLRELNKCAKEIDTVHNVILMKDLGDIREGFWNNDELIDAAVEVEEMSNLHLLGIGTNLGCYGSIAATNENLSELVELTEKVESKIGRKLEYISGGSTSSFVKLIDEDIPERVNLLRIGEAFLIGSTYNYMYEDLKKNVQIDEEYGLIFEDLYQDVFKLRCEVIEIKDKPSYPVGLISTDAFGNKGEYVDIGIRKRALVAVGRIDYVFCNNLFVLEEGVKVIGASSDHTILDITDAIRDIKVGDIIEFGLCYSTLVYLSSSRNIVKIFKK